MHDENGGSINQYIGVHFSQISTLIKIKVQKLFIKFIEKTPSFGKSFIVNYSVLLTEKSGGEIPQFKKKDTNIIPKGYNRRRNVFLYRGHFAIFLKQFPESRAKFVLHWSQPLLKL